jgi:hypothetical protein
VSLPPIAGLRATLVPHREWAISRWFYANPIWYYHRRSTHHELCTGRQFYKLVDPDLRELCALLNRAGLQTTPSCQGHSYPRDRFEAIWRELRREEALIRGDGLEVKDSENDNASVFRDPSYTNPWRSFDDFFREANAHQGIGYLGIILRDVAQRALADDLREAAAAGPNLRAEEHPEIGELLDARLISITVEEPDEQRRSAAWQGVTERVRNVLHTTAVAPR